MLIKDVIDGSAQCTRELVDFAVHPAAWVTEASWSGERRPHAWGLLLWSFSVIVLSSGLFNHFVGPDFFKRIQGTTPIDADVYVNGDRLWPDKSTPEFKEIEWFQNFHIGFQVTEGIATSIKNNETPPVLFEIKEESDVKTFDGVLPGVPTIHHTQKYKIKRVEYLPADVQSGDVKVWVQAVKFGGGWATVSFENVYWENLNPAVLLLLLNIYIVTGAVNIYIVFFIFPHQRKFGDVLRFAYRLSAFGLVFVAIGNCIASPLVWLKSFTVKVLMYAVLCILGLIGFRITWISIREFFAIWNWQVAVAIPAGLLANPLVVSILFIPGCYLVIRFYTLLAIVF